MNNLTKLEINLINHSKALGKTIVIPEAEFSERMILAGLKCVEDEICNVVFLVKDSNFLSKYNIAIDKTKLRIVNIVTDDLVNMLASALYVKRKEKGMTEDEAKNLVTSDPVYFGTMMVELGLVDGLVAGAEIPTAKTFKPALQVIKGKTPSTKISSLFIMVKNDGESEHTFILSDCGMNINPSAEEICEYAIQTADSTKTLTDIKIPKVALLSYSTFGSADGDSAIKMRTAKTLLDAKNVDFIYDGEMQLDAAVVKEVAELKCKTSKIKGDANILIFPDLESGNIGYKIMQRFGGFKAIGPIAQGFKKPINDVSRGASVDEIVLTIAITCLQCD